MIKIFVDFMDSTTEFVSAMSVLALENATRAASGMFKYRKCGIQELGGELYDYINFEFQRIPEILINIILTKLSCPNEWQEKEVRS